MFLDGIEGGTLLMELREYLKKSRRNKKMKLRLMKLI